MVHCKALALSVTVWISIGICARLKMHELRAGDNHPGAAPIVLQLTTGPLGSRMALAPAVAVLQHPAHVILTPLPAPSSPQETGKVAGPPEQTTHPAAKHRRAGDTHPQGKGVMCKPYCDKGEHPKSGKWGTEEEQHLRKIVAEHGSKSWSWIASFIPGRSGRQCRDEWNNNFDKSERLKRGRWSADEDALLKELVAEHGNKNWKRIATRLPGRSDKQCWGRWRVYLRLGFNRTEWTPEQDQEVLDRVLELGNSWSQIAKLYMPSRTGIDIRKRWVKLTAKAELKRHALRN